MSEATNPAEIVGRLPDDQLLGDARDALPETERPPLPERPGRARTVLVWSGAGLTGATLVAGLALIVLAIVDALTRGFRALDVAAAALGALLVATHWGWVHVAEAAAGALERRRGAATRERQLAWLAAVKPYTRYSVTSTALPDGSIRIARTRHRPLPAGERTFTFTREPERELLLSPDEPAAFVTERAEAARREAALDTERERRRFEIAAGAYETAMLGRDDDEQRTAARRAASEALAAQINANLREPPLIE